ncbi:MAG: hypothetical protein HY804_07570 [Nitrospinae bacterium]|nr:hypothetical protein [Nitrospinota bacterium]
MDCSEMERLLGVYQLNHRENESLCFVIAMCLHEYKLRNAPVTGVDEVRNKITRLSRITGELITCFKDLKKTGGAYEAVITNMSQDDREREGFFRFQDLLESRRQSRILSAPDRADSLEARMGRFQSALDRAAIPRQMAGRKSKNRAGTAADLASALQTGGVSPRPVRKFESFLAKFFELAGDSVSDLHKIAKQALRQEK